MWTVKDKSGVIGFGGGASGKGGNTGKVIVKGRGEKRKRCVKETRSNVESEHIDCGLNGRIVKIDESKWRKVKLDETKMFGYDDMAQGLISIEEMDIDDCDLSIYNNSRTKDPASEKSEKNKREKKTQVKKKKKRSKLNEENEDSKSKLSHKQNEDVADIFEGIDENTRNTYSHHWTDLGIPDSLVAGLLAERMHSPTEVQLHSIPAIMRDRKDVLVASQTGSGKTLAFGLPILTYCLKESEKLECNVKDLGIVGLVMVPTRELAMQVYRHVTAVSSRCAKGQIVACPIVGGISIEKQERLIKGQPQIIIATPGRLWELLKQGGKDGFAYLRNLKNVKYLVLDEADRMLERGHFAELKNILEYIPKHSEDISGDNGKGGNGVEEFANSDGGEEEDHVEDDDRVPSFSEIGSSAVIDTSVEETSLSYLGPDRSRQTMVFSATLCLKKDYGKRKELKSHQKAKDGKEIVKGEEQTLERLLSSIDVQKKPQVIDLSTQTVVAANVKEFKIDCVEESKDFYLYYLLKLNPGRTIVFCNSISCIRRLLSIFSLLFGSPSDKDAVGMVLGLHANMQQRQRMKNLDRFKKCNGSILITTDVAARGLDISLVEHVVHYQMPRDVDTYVHRAGRTARGESTLGTSVALVSPEDSSSYKKILKTLQKGW